MKILELLPEEFEALDGVHDGFRPSPKNAIALIAEEDGEIVGRIFIVAPAHVEGPWVKETLRGSDLFKRLVKRAEMEAAKRGITALFAYGANKQMEDYIERLGYKKQDLTVWKKEI